MEKAAKTGFMLLESVFCFTLYFLLAMGVWCFAVDYSFCPRPQIKNGIIIAAGTFRLRRAWHPQAHFISGSNITCFEIVEKIRDRELFTSARHPHARIAGLKFFRQTINTPTAQIIFNRFACRSFFLSDDTLKIFWSVIPYIIF